MSDERQRRDLNAALKAYVDGDDSAFDIIINEMRNPLIFFINGYVNNLDVAEDLCMDTFAALLLNIGRFNYKCGLSTFLFTIARNKTVDYIRHRSVLRVTELEGDEADPDFKAIEDEYIKNDEYARLHKELKLLPEKYHTVLYLHYFEEMPVEEISAVMKKNRKQVYNLLFRAKNELRKRMSE